MSFFVVCYSDPLILDWVLDNMFTAQQQNTFVPCVLNSMYNSLIDLLVALDIRLSGSP